MPTTVANPRARPGRFEPKRRESRPKGFRQPGFLAAGRDAAMASRTRGRAANNLAHDLSTNHSVCGSRWPSKTLLQEQEYIADLACVGVLSGGHGNLLPQWTFPLAAHRALVGGFSEQKRGVKKGVQDRKGSLSQVSHLAVCS